MPRFTTSDDVALSYLDEGSGTPVVLIAGYAAPATTWALTADALVAAGYRAISFDRRSHGDSDSPLYGQRMSRHGKDIEELLAALDLNDAILVGGSMGGSAIWAYLSLFGSERVRAVVTVDQTPKMINTADWASGFYGLTAENSGTFFVNGIPDTGRGRTLESSRPGFARLIERLGGMPELRVANAPETVRLLQDHANQDWRDVVARLDVPFLMVAGSDSQLWPSTHATESVRDNPHGTATIVESSGHAVNFDSPDQFNSVLLDFLRQL
jgi:non-heme chloroperoxidase